MSEPNPNSLPPGDERWARDTLTRFDSPGFSVFGRLQTAGGNTRSVAIGRNEARTEARVDGERDDHGHHAGGDAQNRNTGDERDHRLLALGFQIAQRDEELEAAR